MKKRSWLVGTGLNVLLCLFVFSQPSRADTVVFSNLGPGNSYYSCSCGWGVGYSFGAGSPYGSMAVPFTPSSSGDLSRILIALTGYAGPYATVELLNDNHGAPTGSILESWTAAGLPGWRTTSTIQPSQTLNSTGGVLLTGGTQYWIDVLPNAPGYNYFVWMPSTTNQFQVQGQFPFCSNGCSNEYNTQFAPAFAVVTTPEPSSLALFSAGFAALPWFRRRIGKRR